jgi:uncharacterized protein (DUF2336 family)
VLAPQLRQGLLARLDALARIGGEVPCDAVLDLVVDLFAAQGEGMSPEACDGCLDLASMLIGRAAPEARGKALRRLCASPAVPADRLAEWARGPIETAAPVIEHAAKLPSWQLLEILRVSGPEPMRAAARRPSLSEDVADHIVARGDGEAVALLAANRSARLSQRSFGALADLAWRDAGLRDAFVRRSDLPGEMVDRLWPSLHAGFKARLVASGFRYSMSEVAEVGREASAALVEAVRSGSLPQSIDTYAALVRDGLIGIDEALVEIMQTGRLVEAAQLIARCHRLDEGVALNLLYGVYDHGPAVLARHAALSEDVCLRIAEARSRLSWVPSTDLGRMLATARGITAEEAAEILGALQGLWQAGIANTGERRRFRSAA